MGRTKGSSIGQGRITYEAGQVNGDALSICDYYLQERRKEGRRYTYRCPECGGRRFEVEPVRGIAGCFSAGCGLPTSTDAVGIIAYMEGMDTRGTEFVECLRKGYEILGLDTDAPVSPTPEPKPESPSNAKDDHHPKRRTWIAGEARTEARNSSDVSDVLSDSDGSDEDLPGTTRGGRPIEAYTELADGTHQPIEAFVIEDVTPCGLAVEEGTSLPVSGLPLTLPARKDPAGKKLRRTEAQRLVNHRVFAELMKMCPLEERDRSFFETRGLDEAAIREGRFGSISKKRCRYVTGRLEEIFPDEELLTVPGFYRTDAGTLRFSLYGDYALIPYYDREGYILTVEGRLIGEPKSQRDKKYKALLGSGAHLYVHPRFDPEEVVAFCEGAIGAMVAARCGIPVAAIKGMRNYRQPPEGREEGYSVLPELQGVNFGGREVVYIPDLDVKPKTRAEAMAEVPKACEWLIERQRGRAKVALLPREVGAEEDGPGGAKDLDEWLLSLIDDERVEKFRELLEGAIEIEEWETGEDKSEEVAINRLSGEEARQSEDQLLDPDPPAATEEGQQSSLAKHPPAKEPPVESPAQRTLQGRTPRSGETTAKKSRLLSEVLSDAEGQDQPARKGPGMDDPQAGTPRKESSRKLPEKPGSGEASEEGGADKENRSEPEDTEQNPAPGSAAANDPQARRCLAAETHSGMAFWYETRNLTDTQVDQIREAKERYDQRREQNSRRRAGRPIYLPKWNIGEIAIALAVSFFVAVAILVGIYYAREQEGMLGSVGELLTKPVWWIEIALGWSVGLLVAEIVVRIRHRMRYRQLLDHLRGRQ